MILLLGGAAETALLATAIAEAGFDVLVSTATTVALDVGKHSRIRRRTGPLGKTAMEGVILEHGIEAIVDASHPYASSAHANASTVAEKLELPYLRWRRPETPLLDGRVAFADNHEEAAALAFSHGEPVLLTTGSRNLTPYAKVSRATGVDLVVRVLPHPDSVKAAEEAGIDHVKIVTGRGPFSVDENLDLIRRFGIGVLVTKDGGEEGGVPAKIEAAHREHCRVIVIRRPPEPEAESFDNVSELVSALCSLPVSKAGQESKGPAV